jgi:hypothetical protein
MKKLQLNAVHSLQGKGSNFEKTSTRTSGKNSRKKREIPVAKQ